MRVVPTQHDVSLPLKVALCLTFCRIYALRALLDALSPLIGAEIELGNKAVQKGWAEGVPKEKIQEWRKVGNDSLKDEMERIAQQTCADEYGRLMRKVRTMSSLPVSFS